MNEILSVEMGLDWVDGGCEPGGLIWTGDVWSLADNSVGTAAHDVVVSGLDSQGCAAAQDDSDAEDFFDIGPVAVFAHHAGRLTIALAA